MLRRNRLARLGSTKMTRGSCTTVQERCANAPVDLYFAAAALRNSLNLLERAPRFAAKAGPRTLLAAPGGMIPIDEGLLL
jgi:hypothetical protein